MAKAAWIAGSLVILVSWLFSQQTSPTPRATASDPNFARIPVLIQKKMADEQIPSIAVAVAQNGNIIWEQAFGTADREKGIPATIDTPYYVASVTKSITSAALMLLVEHGELNLDAPVNKYLALSKVHSPMWDANAATVRLVATHNAGLTTYLRKCVVGDNQCKVSTDRAIERYGVLFWPPGDHFDYSNLGYGILDTVIERASGKSYGSFLRDDLFRPLGMQDCFLGMRSETKNVAAAQYDSTSHERSPMSVSDTPGASSIRCSVHSLALFGMFVLKAHLPKQERILSDKTIDAMLNSTVNAPDGEQYGIGWWVQPNMYGYRNIFAQGGTNDSFAVLQMIPSENIVVAVLANTGTTFPSTLVEELLSALLPNFAEARRTAASRPKNETAKPDDTVRTSALVGSWRGSVYTWKGAVTVAATIPSKGGIQVKVGSQPATVLKDASADASHLYGVVRGDLGTPDAAKPPYDIQIELYLRGDKLVGAATAVPRPDEDGPELPYWVVLERER